MHVAPERLSRYEGFIFATFPERWLLNTDDTLI